MKTLKQALDSFKQTIADAPARAAPPPPPPAPTAQRLPLEEGRTIDLPTKRQRRAEELGRAAGKGTEAFSGYRLAAVAKIAADFTLRQCTYAMFTRLVWYYRPGKVCRRSWLSIARELAISDRAAYRARQELIQADWIALIDKGIYIPPLELCLPKSQRIRTRKPPPPLPFKTDDSPGQYILKQIERANSKGE